MGFYNTIKIISQSLFLFILGEGGPPAHKHRLNKNLIIYLTGMGYYVINNYIPFGGIRIKKLKPPQTKERINMIKQLQEVSLKSLDMINKNADNLNKLAEFVSNLQDNQNLMATKILKLEKILARYQMTEGLNERSSN